MSEDLPGLLAAGLEALRSGRPDQAVERLRIVAEDPALAAQDDLRDVAARVFSLLAQSLLEAGRPREAEPWARRALATAEALGDARGTAEVQALHRRIFAAATEIHRAEQAARAAATLAATTLEEVLARHAGDAERAPALVAKASADLDAGRPADGSRAAHLALASARAVGDVREEVLAELLLARAHPQDAPAHLAAAWKRADEAGETTLVGAVARAAEIAGVELAVLDGPGLEGEG